MKTYNLKLTFLWDDANDISVVVVEVPEDVKVSSIKKALLRDHEYLCVEDEGGIYDEHGRNAETLMDYTCIKNGWSWHRFQFDGEVGLV